MRFRSREELEDFSIDLYLYMKKWKINHPEYETHIFTDVNNNLLTLVIYKEENDKKRNSQV